MSIAVLDNNFRTDDGNDRLHRVFQIGAKRYFHEYLAEVQGETSTQVIDLPPAGCNCYYNTIDGTEYVMWLSTTQKIIGIGEVL